MSAFPCQEVDALLSSASLISFAEDTKQFEVWGGNAIIDQPNARASFIFTSYSCEIFFKENRLLHSALFLKQEKK